MSEEKKKQLIEEGVLNPDGSRPAPPPPPPSDDPDAISVVAEAEAVVAQAVDPSQEG